MSHKKITDPQGEMERLLKKAVETAKAPFNGTRDPALPSLRAVAAELGTTVIRTRKLLITAGYFSSPTSTAVQRMKEEGKSVDEIGAELKLGPAAVYAYLPFEGLAYNLPQTTSNSDRHKRYRATKKLREAVDAGEWGQLLWRCVVIFQDYPFQTSGRGSKSGTSYTYIVSKESGKGGRHYEGESITGYGNEIFVVIDGVKKERSISRSTVDLAFQTYLTILQRDGTVTGPKKLGVFGASYLLPMFQRFVE